MEDELQRLQDLDSLASQVLTECANVESRLAGLQSKLSDFEQTSTSMIPEDAAKVSGEIRRELEALQAVLEQQDPRVQQLKEGNYHNSEEIEKRYM